MPLELKKLEKVVDLADGMKRARCPACSEQQQDKRGEHLRIYPDGKFGCCVHPGDREHRRRIYALAGERGRQGIKVRVAAAKSASPVQTGILGRIGRIVSSQANHPALTDATDGVNELQSQSGNKPDWLNGVNPVETQPAESRTLRTGETKSSGDGCSAADEPRTLRTGLSNSNGELALDECLPLADNANLRTQRTPQYSLYIATQNINMYLNNIYIRGFRGGVRSVREREEVLNSPNELAEGVRSVREGEKADKPPTTAEKQERLPYLTPGGSLVIPFNSPERYHWWKGDDRLSPDQTLAEIRQRTGTEKRKTQNGTGI